MNHNRKTIGRLHVITDTVVQTRFGHTELARLAAAGGADCIQLRDKNLGRGELAEVARSVLAACRKAGVSLIINDDVELAVEVGADGVHLGRSDTPIPEARAALGPDKTIGGTAGSIEELKTVERLGADYVGFGHVFATASKAKAGRPLGVENLRRAVLAANVPVIAIGGVSAGNLPEVMAAGAWGAAVIGAVCGAADPAAAAAELRAIIDASREDHG